MIREPGEMPDARFFQSYYSREVYFRLSCYHWGMAPTPGDLVMMDPAEPIRCAFCEKDVQMHVDVQASIYAYEGD